MEVLFGLADSLGYTEPKALERINKFSNIDLKVFVATKEIGFHTKAYIFENQEEYKIIIGSSNITQRALKSNIEWNVSVISKKDDTFVKEVLEEYLNLWEDTSVLNEEFLENYKSFIEEIRKAEKRKSIDFSDYEIIKPNHMQKRAIDNLNRLRHCGEDRALVIAATGTGKTYIGFVANMEKDDELKKLSEDEVFLKILKELSSKLPIKRVYEFSILKYTLTHEEISAEKAKQEILKYIDDVDDESVIHALNCLNRAYYDSAHLKNNVKSFELKDGVLNRTWDFKKIIQNKKYRIYIEDAINYALIRYEKEFESKYYGVPFFKLYEQYQMVDTALLSNYTKIHSSFRGSGLITNGNEYFLFIDLHKEENIKESINYKDKFIDRQYFQWQSPNSTSQSSERGKNII